jgi:hypothetical protein
VSELIMNANNDEGKLIGGKEALIALANGEDVDACVTLRQNRDEWHWFDAKTLTVNEIEVMETDGDSYGGDILEIAFRLKPKTITINGIEVPAPADDKDYHHQGIWILNSLEPKEYGYVVLDITDELPRYWWKSEGEIKQVVAALRQVFGGAV